MAETCEPPDSAIVDVDTIKVTSPKAQVWINLGGDHILFMEDKWIIDSGKRLNNRIISASMGVFTTADILVLERASFNSGSVQNKVQ